MRGTLPTSYGSSWWAGCRGGSGRRLVLLRLRARWGRCLASSWLESPYPWSIARGLLGRGGYLPFPRGCAMRILGGRAYQWLPLRVLRAGAAFSGLEDDMCLTWAPPDGGWNVAVDGGKVLIVSEPTDTPASDDWLPDDEGVRDVPATV